MSEFLSNLALISDKAIDDKNENKIRNIINDYSDNIESLTISIDKAYGYYILGNLWSGSRHIKHEKNTTKVWSLEQEEVFKEIYYFRKAIQQKDFENLDLSLQLAIYVNLGNAFSHYGRTINAIKYFDKAIALKIIMHPKIKTTKPIVYIP